MAERFRIPWTTGKFEVSQPESTIAPPPEPSDTQVGEWLIDDGYPWDPQEEAVITITASRLKNVARQAAQWGADQQLAKDAEWLDQHALDAPHLKITPVGASLKEAMRPKPPTLKEQALCELVNAYNSDQINDSTYDTIRKALKALPND